MTVAVLIWITDDGTRVVEGVFENYGLAMLRREELMKEFPVASRDFAIEEHEVQT